jgi:hypothetical protein
VKFRRDLDFDDLIETIDQLAAEDIDEVVDWQLTESKAAKVEKGPARSGVLGSNWTTRFAQAAAEGVAAALGQVAASNIIGIGDGSSGGGGGYTADALDAMRNTAWTLRGRADQYVRDVENAQRRSRYQVPPGTREFVAYETPPLNSFDPNRSGLLPEPVRTRRVEFDVQTMLDPITDTLHVRLVHSIDGSTERRRYQQTAVSWEALTSLRGPFEILRAPNVLPGRDIVVELDPGAARNRSRSPIQTFIESLVP